MNRSTAILALSAVTFITSPAKAEEYFGTATFNNGRSDSAPAGTGEVDVFFTYPTVVFGVSHFADYYEVATHQVDYTYAPGPGTFLWANAMIVNSTGIAWQGFQIRLEGADFAGHGGPNPVQAPEIDPVVDIGVGGDGFAGLGSEFIAIGHWISPDNFSLAGSSIMRSNNQGSGNLDAELLINLDNPLEAGRIFRLFYNIIPPAGDPTSTGFSVFLTPIPVPEPATAALLALAGLVAPAGRRRSR